MKKLLFILLALVILCSCEKDEIVFSDYSNIKVLELKIGGWNMDKDKYHSVPIVGDFSFRDIQEMVIHEAWIVSESDNSVTNLLTYCDSIGDFNGQIYLTKDSVQLVRNSNSYYNSKDYDNDEINRGTLIIKYR